MHRKKCIIVSHKRMEQCLSVKCITRYTRYTSQKPQTQTRALRNTQQTCRVQSLPEEEKVVRVMLHISPQLPH